MSQQLPENSDSQQPDANSTQQADNSAHQNVVQGNQNRVVQGNENQSVLGDNNTVVQGSNNLMFVIKELILGQQTTTPIGNPARPKNERLLLAAVKEEVTARLRQSLHNAVLINLGKESQPQQVKRPWDAEIKIGLKPPERLPDTTTILEVFDSKEIAGKLLILGAPGAGKTTTQLKLAEVLVSRAGDDSSYPIPVLFNLSSFQGDKALSEWLVSELKSKYDVPTKVGKKWLKEDQLLLLLDGLDELSPKKQELCVQAINQLLQKELPQQRLVVCSRTEEYNNYSTYRSLSLSGAICLQSITDGQLKEYLIGINQTKILEFIRKDPNLLELVKTPLLLSITILAFPEISQSWHKASSIEESSRQDLLDSYIDRMCQRELNEKIYLTKKPPKNKQTKIWLTWLAQQLKQESKTEFLIEQMQPFYLSRKNQQNLYKIITNVFIWGFISLEFILIIILYSLLNGEKLNYNYLIYSWPIFYLCKGVIIKPVFQFLKLDLSLKLNENIKHIKIKNYIWNRESFSYKINQKIILGLVIGAIIWWIDDKLNYTKLIFWLPIGIIITMGCFILCEGLYTPAIDKTKIANQGILKSALNSGFIFLIVIIVSGLIGHLLAKILNIKVIQPIISLFIPMFISVLAGHFCGGKAAIQHFALRLILYFSGYIPWNYARFLDYCIERMFLQRVGGRYLFIHKLLQDHFAKMDLKQNSENKTKSSR
ncbi:NACHT domain-containing protein [Nostoc sp. 'Peltigera membranacea cyanobiont' N6]|uniref:NACHT domain-containing protein n=1 Tax=Nostoc sp. 'Peltigera membranacea cyanobiont' N6 TaxID=1261031 RepID=UPI000CF34B24|nr:NACHT domain-containing protein [Nostoc sp. 'Peltigera membranacea cyanobiont' N6]AVH68418.1 signal transduction protein with NACHT domain [Nostoc sp. 'Peltigera membranacea cyanobiont' N6]